MINVLTLLFVHGALAYLLWNAARAPDPEADAPKRPFLPPRANGPAAAGAEQAREPQPQPPRFAPGAPFQRRG